ncbi:hypothetical protein [Cohnella cellulosilytica]|uniref:Uncharacterized protein n=1 Tax=Cohnella cellulosilytica TaxID=986710 RepID=A0ABW2FD25_9BACL
MPSAATAHRVSQLTSFINYAEGLWFSVRDSASDGQSFSFNGDEYRCLPDRFGSREKIEAYFGRCWSKELSRIMLCNLDPINYQGKRYVLADAPGPAPRKVESLRIVSRNASRIRVSAVLSGGGGGNKTIRYTLARTGERLTIIARTDRSNDYRYARCTS